MTPETTNFDAARTTLKALTAAGQLHEADAARVAMVLSLAQAVDDEPDNASLWREYRAAEASLHETRDGATDDEAALIKALSAPVGNAKNTRAAHTRKPGIRGR